MTTYVTPDFAVLRDQWALKAVIDPEDVKLHQRYDQQANPHNDSYKPSRRTATEIISDLSFSFADKVLEQQYAYMYRTWLRESGFAEDVRKNWKLRT